MTNIDRLRGAMQSQSIPAILLSDIASVQWATGFTGSAGWVLLTPEKGAFLTDSRYTIQAQEEVADLPCASFANPKTSAEFLKEHIEDLGIASIGFESQSVTYSTYEDWKQALNGVELVGVKSLVAPLRMIKTRSESDAVREACKLADACFDHVTRMIQPGVREYDLGLDIEFFFRRQGAELAFEPIVVSGERSARPHGGPSEKPLQRGDFVTMDFGAKLNGFCSDITRTVVIGEASDRHVEVYEQVLKAQLAALAAIRPGVAARDVDQVARDVLEEKGLAKYFGHGLGHGLGRLVHDAGRMSAASSDVIEEGQVWTVEPGVYIEGFGGVRIEDDVLVTSDGVEVLTKSPKGLLVLPLAS